MAGTATNQDITKITRGPGKFWLNLAVPSGGARLTLFTDGTPDATANPSAKQLGLTRAGSKVSLKTSLTKNEADELTAPYRQILASDDMSVEGEWLQLEDFTLLKVLTPNGTFGSGSGYEQITVGGQQTIPSLALPSGALIWPSAADATKFCVAHMYQALNTAGLEFTINRKTDAGSNYKFEGQSITSRTAGDQVGNLWHQV